MQTHHTPGPWAVDLHLITTADGETLVAKASTDRSLARVEANARLIAAAPDLLAALESLDAARGHTFHKPAGQKGFDAVVIPRDIFDAAIAAIARATGQ